MSYINNDTNAAFTQFLAHLHITSFNLSLKNVVVMVPYIDKYMECLPSGFISHCTIFNWLFLRELKYNQEQWLLEYSTYRHPHCVCCYYN